MEPQSAERKDKLESSSARYLHEEKRWSYKKIAKYFGVSKGVIEKISHRDGWITLPRGRGAKKRSLKITTPIVDGAAITSLLALRAIITRKYSILKRYPNYNQLIDYARIHFVLFQALKGKSSIHPSKIGEFSSDYDIPRSTKSKEGYSSAQIKIKLWEDCGISRPSHTIRKLIKKLR